MKSNLVQKTVTPRKRKGRGPGSGMGKTSGRGHKGQKSRSGQNIPRGFEGGQTPLKRRIPKLGGFNRGWSAKPVVVNLDQIEKAFKTNEVVTPKTLAERGIIKSPKLAVKILGNGKITKKVKVKNCDYSQSVAKKLGLRVRPKKKHKPKNLNKHVIRDKKKENAKRIKKIQEREQPTKKDKK